ncbi:unannotated protein [freshwater metagenome]|uniref:Unannotated protein n=1 Tax=freshwater metagenome TaxID=449393 RepID=A0A6J6I631_9ZZZZ
MLTPYSSQYNEPVSATIHRTTGALRLLRAAALTSAMLILTAVAHTQAHGDLPSTGSLLVLTPLVFALSALLLGRQRGYSMVIAFSIGTQALLHVLLTVGAGHGSHHASLMPSVSMILAHAGAAVVIAIALAHADALLHRWMEIVRTALFSHFSLALPVRPAGARWFTQSPTLLVLQDLDHAIHRRGPPSVI